MLFDFLDSRTIDSFYVHSRAELFLAEKIKGIPDAREGTDYWATRAINNTLFCEDYLSFGTTVQYSRTTQQVKIVLRFFSTALTCPRLNNIANIQTISIKDNVATYTCKSGYKVNGPIKRYCLPGLFWSGRQPTCDRKKSICHKISEAICFAD